MLKSAIVLLIFQRPKSFGMILLLVFTVKYAPCNSSSKRAEFTHPGHNEYNCLLRLIYTLIAEIDILNSMPKCIYVSCNCACESTKKLYKYDNMLKLIQFLMGLSDQYISVRGQSFMMQPMPSISQVFSLLLQEESLRDFVKLGQSPLTESMALTVKYNNMSKFKNTGQ